MPDEIQKGQDIEVKDNQVDMPATEQPAEAKAEEQKEGELPQDTKERTRQEFEKLKEKNRLFAEKLAKYEMQDTNSLIDNLTGGTQQQIAKSNLPIEKVEDIVKDLTDENGYINEALLKETLSKASSNANQAVQAAQLAQEQAKKAEQRISQYEQSEQSRRAYQDFPQSNPDSDDYDAKFLELVKNEMIGQAMNRIKPNFYEACKKWASLARREEPAQDKEKAAEKVQINAGGSKPQPVNHDKLVQGTMKGDHNSIAARLAASGF
jgi:hypothetical protein